MSSETIWSKIEAEKQRQNEIRERHSVGRSKSFESGVESNQVQQPQVPISKSDTEWTPSSPSRSMSAPLTAPPHVQPLTLGNDENGSKHNQANNNNEKSISSSYESSAAVQRRDSPNSSLQESATANENPETHSVHVDHKVSVSGSTRVIDPSKVTHPERWVYCIASLLFLIITAGISCIVLFVFGAWGDQTSEAQRLQAQVEYLSKDASVFEDPLSPQSQAVDWMVNADESGIDWQHDQIRRESRYALAVFYFSTGSQWVDPLNFLSKDHECKWNNGRGKGVGCKTDELVTILAIPSNGLRGQLPVELSGLSHLQLLRLSDNLVTGRIPFFTFSQLQELQLDQNRIEGLIPSSLSALTTLKTLNLTMNLLSSSLPINFSRLTALEILSVSSNALTGSISTELGPLEMLRSLDLSENSITGSLDVLEYFPSLEHLDLSFNEFSTMISFNLEVLPNLESISLANNQIEGVIPSTIGFLTNLQFMDFSENLLSGIFPWPSFSGNNTRLKQLVLSQNTLSGSIPEKDLSRFNHLEVIDLGRNMITGDLPNVFGSLSGLRVLDLSDNRFDGTLPANMGSAKSLIFLSVAGNELSGTISSTLGRLNSLRELNLHGNQFFGTIPLELQNLVTIERISLQNNVLTGNVNFLCSEEPSPIISADCGGNASLVICNCCDICFE